MTYYIKVRPYVAQKLGVEDERYRYADGNVLIWDKELRLVDVGWVFHPEETVARIGGLMMDPYRNREEQQKSAEDCTPLPIPTDPEWTEPQELLLEEALAIGEAAAVEEAIEETIEETIEEVAEEITEETEMEQSEESEAPFGEGGEQ